ncbi:MAG: hypothetical protein JW847_09025 [Candidatus Omnitrophica bacterium]|nr:hypothetical protein [Candidatus Omnitrophota bacterium]
MPKEQQIDSIIETVMTVCIAGLLLLSGIQQIHRYDFFKNEQNIFGGETVEERNQILFGRIYDFAQTCKKLLPGTHQGKLMTDLDLNNDPYMLLHRILSYHLYPEISLRLDNGAPNDTIVSFYKHDALMHIPENYRILVLSKDKNYILAIENRSLK